MFRVALTGNVASGKSTVLDLFREWGANVLDADVLARDAVAPGTPGLAAVLARFGQDLRRGDGTLDRPALRRRVLADPADLEALNAIVHPIVARLSAEAEHRLAVEGARMVVHDIPLLFEVLDPAAYDVVVLVDAPLAARRARLAERGLPRDEAEALIAAQLPAEVKRLRSHLIVENDSTREVLAGRARAAWSELQRRAGIA